MYANSLFICQKSGKCTAATREIDRVYGYTTNRNNETYFLSRQQLQGRQFLELKGVASNSVQLNN